MNTKHYDSKYFSYQQRIGEFGGKLNASKFSSHISEMDTVLDFGCGGGYILKNIHCKRKIGIEVNDTAKEYAIKNGIELYDTLENIPNSSVDILITHHVLEHLTNPFSALESMHRVLKENCKLIIVVPNEKVKKYIPNDINNHLYTWTEMNLGNLVNEAGFSIQSVKEFYHRWPPFYLYIHKITGDKIFNLLAIVYGYIFRNLSQIKLIAVKKIK